MAVSPTVLIDAAYASSSQTTQYTATNVVTIIDAFTVTNVDTVTRTISVNLVPFGGSAAATNLVVKTKSILAGQTEPLLGIVGHMLEAGDFISTIASAASALVIRASGREVTL